MTDIEKALLLLEDSLMRVQVSVALEPEIHVRRDLETAEHQIDHVIEILKNFNTPPKGLADD